MARPYDAAQRRALAATLSEEGEPRCPACGGRVSVQAVPRPHDVSYVRRRAWVLCLECGRTAAVDVTADGPP